MFSPRCQHLTAEPSCVLWWLLRSGLEAAVPSTAQPLLPPHRGHPTPCHLPPKASRPDLMNPNFLMFARGQVPIKLWLLRCHTAYWCFQAFQQLELPDCFGFFSLPPTPILLIQFYRVVIAIFMLSRSSVTADVSDHKLSNCSFTTLTAESAQGTWGSNHPTNVFQK